MNKYSKEYLEKLLINNVQCDYVFDSFFGEIIEFTPRVAYRFLLCTNSIYMSGNLATPLFGQLQTFKHRKENLAGGLFVLKDDEKIINTLPSIWNKNYPTLFTRKKKLLLIDPGKTSDTEILHSVYQKIISNHLDPLDYILAFVKKSSSGWEHYFEFLISEKYIQQGYFTDVQIPFSTQEIPDFGIYKHEYIKEIKKNNWINSGALILELSALRYFRKNQDVVLNDDYDYQFIVGEVKTNSKSSQIENYLTSGISHQGMEFIHHKKNHEKHSNLAFVNSNFEIEIKGSLQNPYINREKIKIDKQWFESYLKLHLLGNLNINELRTLFVSKLNSSDLTVPNLLLLSKLIDINELLKIIN
tara:strand:+ start:1444 stop:2517 length:1074 start_codon:yes stop_codon:yes gene_type:complete